MGPAILSDGNKNTVYLSLVLVQYEDTFAIGYNSRLVELHTDFLGQHLTMGGGLFFLALVRYSCV